MRLVADCLQLLTSERSFLWSDENSNPDPLPPFPRINSIPLLPSFRPLRTSLDHFRRLALSNDLDLIGATRSKRKQPRASSASFHPLPCPSPSPQAASDSPFPNRSKVTSCSWVKKAHPQRPPPTIHPSPSPPSTSRPRFLLNPPPTTCSPPTTRPHPLPPLPRCCQSRLPLSFECVHSSRAVSGKKG